MDTLNAALERILIRNLRTSEGRHKLAMALNWETARAYIQFMHEQLVLEGFKGGLYAVGKRTTSQSGTTSRVSA